MMRDQEKEGDEVWIVGILGLVQAYVFQNFYFLNITVENKIKILLI